MIADFPTPGCLVQYRAMIHIAEPYRALLAERGLGSLEAVMALDARRLVGGHPQRHVVRLDWGDAREPVTVYLKRDYSRLPGDWLRAVLRGRWPHSRSVYEWRMLETFRRAGFACPEPIAAGERRVAGLPGESFVMLRELTGVEPMTPFLHRLGPGRDRRAVVAWLGDQVARLHEAGLWHTDLFSKHVLLGGGPEGWRWAMMDLQRARAARTTPGSARLHDLAALEATTPSHVASRTDRLRFLHAYLKTAGRAGDWKRFARRVLAEAEGLLRRRKIQNMRQAGPPDTPTPEVVLLDHGRIRAQADFVPAMARAGLVTMDAMMTTRGTEFLRQLRDRANVRIAFGDHLGRPLAGFLKRHVSRHLWAWLRRGFSCRNVLGPGTIEAHNVHRLAMAGVPTMTVMAHGQRTRRLWQVESFVLVERIADAMPLDDHLRERFGPTEPGPADMSRRQLVRRVAELVRRFHHAGLNHRDLYCCHVFVQARPDGPPGLYLIDLQRVQRRRYGRRRWLVKDLAQLAYSAPADRMSRTDRMRFFQTYLGVAKLQSAHKRLARAVLAKVRRIAGHKPRQ